MIRRYAPILLIPAAWILTGATILTELDSYWIRHMHYFMIIFLAGFLLLSWDEMKKDVLIIWRRVMLFGLAFTILGALSFELGAYSSILAASTVFYWYLGPALGIYLSGKHMENYSSAYQKLSTISISAAFLLAFSLYTNHEISTIASFIIISSCQLISIVIASELDPEGLKLFERLKRLRR